jgi:Ser/Thr protein kinase RdoA (MazF antagonist)
MLTPTTTTLKPATTLKPTTTLKPATMTSTSHGLAPDPALPARDELLDPSLVAELLSACMGEGRIDVSGAELIRVKYRIGESLRVLYRLDIAGRSTLVTGRMFTGGRGASAHRKAAKVAPASVLPGGLRATALDPGRDTVWWSFPNDRRLVGLDEVLDPSRLPPVLREAIGDWSGTAVVQYAPERSVTLRAVDPADQTLAFVKCYAPDTVDVEQLAARYDLVASRLRAADPTLRSPRALAHSTDHRMLLLEPMPGRSWLDLSRPTAVEALGRLGRAIAIVHATPLGGGTTTGLRRFGRLDLGRVTRAGELISQARPEIGAAASSLAERLAYGPPEPQEQVLLHGDCHPGNVLVADAGVSLIDLDQAGTGPAAADIGSLLARLTYGAVMGEHDPATSNVMAIAFLEGYAQVRSLPDERTLRWYGAAALLTERGLRAVNRIRPQALTHLGDLVSAGHELLDGVS